MTRITAITLAVLLSGCAPAGLWINPSATQSKFATDRYDCMRESRRPVASARIGPYGGNAYQSVEPDEGVFGACMAARGYSWKVQK